MTVNLKAKKANVLADSRNVHAFEISKSATKSQVSEAIKTFYKVTPTKVNVVRNPEKKIFVRGKVGKKQSVKKAYVFLKKGDKIE